MSTYKFRTTPYAHQKAALRKILRQGYGGALLMEPRTGKSKVTVDWLCIQVKKGRLDRALIICPNRVMGTWVNELLLHAPIRVHVTVWDAAERKRGVPATPAGYDLYVILVNFDAFGTPGKKTSSGRRSKASGRFKHRAMIKKWIDGRPAACVVDESHKIKSPSGKVSNMIVSMHSMFPYRLILTGTPMTKANRAFDIYMQWKFLNPDRFSDLPTVGEFKEEFGQWTQRNGFPQFLRPKNMKKLHQRIQEDAFIIRRDECFDLPPREDIIRLVELDASRGAYDQMAEEMIALINEAEGKVAEASIKLVQSLRLGQITSGFVTLDDGTIERLGYEKAHVLKELIIEEAEKDQKIVVVARWKPDLDLIEAMARDLDLPVWSVRGGVKRSESDQHIIDFRNHTDAGVMVLQPAASSLGIDLSTAAHMVWYSHTPSWVDFTQCCDRIALSRASTTFTHLVATKSVDEVVLNTLANDGDMGRAILSHPTELIQGHPLDLDDYSRLKGIGLFQPHKKGRSK